LFAGQGLGLIILIVVTAGNSASAILHEYQHDYKARNKGRFHFYLRYEISSIVTETVKIIAN
jgi:predicted proteasome-type protease